MRIVSIAIALMLIFCISADGATRQKKVRPQVYVGVVVKKAPWYIAPTEFEHYDIPNPLKVLGIAGAPTVLLGGMFCVFGNLAIASLQVRRELRMQEAWEIMAACVLPGLGPAIVHRMFLLHGHEWEQLLKQYPRWTVDHVRQIW